MFRADGHWRCRPAKPTRRPAEERGCSWPGWGRPSRVTASWLQSDGEHMDRPGTLGGCWCCRRLSDTVTNDCSSTKYRCRLYIQSIWCELYHNFLLLRSPLKDNFGQIGGSVEQGIWKSVLVILMNVPPRVCLIHDVLVGRISERFNMLCSEWSNLWEWLLPQYLQNEKLM